jgi:predicted transcriptional regulator
MQTLNITISDEMAEALKKLAEQEYRNPEQQAAAIIHQELVKCKLLNIKSKKEIATNNQKEM